MIFSFKNQETRKNSNSPDFQCHLEQRRFYVVPRKVRRHKSSTVMLKAVKNRRWITIRKKFLQFPYHLTTQMEECEVSQMTRSTWQLFQSQKVPGPPSKQRTNMAYLVFLRKFRWTFPSVLDQSDINQEPSNYEGTLRNSEGTCGLISRTTNRTEREQSENRARTTSRTEWEPQTEQSENRARTTNRTEREQRGPKPRNILNEQDRDFAQLNSVSKSLGSATRVLIAFWFFDFKWLLMFVLKNVNNLCHKN
jgi:hypothetical protein